MGGASQEGKRGGGELSLLQACFLFLFCILYFYRPNTRYIMAIESNLFKNNGNPVDTCHDVDFNTVLGLDTNSGTCTSWQLGTEQGSTE